MTYDLVNLFYYPSDVEWNAHSSTDQACEVLKKEDYFFVEARTFNDWAPPEEKNLPHGSTQSIADTFHFLVFHKDYIRGQMPSYPYPTQK